MVETRSQNRSTGAENTNPMNQPHGSATEQTDPLRSLPPPPVDLPIPHRADPVLQWDSRRLDRTIREQVNDMDY